MYVSILEEVVYSLSEQAHRSHFKNSRRRDHVPTVCYASMKPKKDRRDPGTSVLSNRLKLLNVAAEGVYCSQGSIQYRAKCGLTALASGLASAQRGSVRLMAVSGMIAFLEKATSLHRRCYCESLFVVGGLISH